MSELRWILLAAGIVLLLGIYLFSRRTADKRTGSSIRREPRLAAADEPAFDSAAPAVAEPAPAEAERPAASLYDQSPLPLSDAGEPGVGSAASGNPDNEKIVAIRVAARGARRFRGPDLVAALEAESLQFGELGIYHRRTGNRSIFSVSSMVEPGHFDPATIEDYTTPGLSFFMIIPGPESPVAAFTEMLSTARRVATAIDGEVLDESGSTLSRQAASHMREQIIEFAHRVR